MENKLDDIEEEDLSISATRPVLPPRARCVAASNGWIVAAVECTPPPPPSASFPSSSPSSSMGPSSSPAAATGGVGTVAGGGGQPTLSKHGIPLTTLIPPLRLISRWNVRRGTSLGLEGNHLVPLPPPVRPNVHAMGASPADEFPFMGAASSAHAIDASSTSNLYAGSSSALSPFSHDPNFGRIVHAFVDPTGCHVLLSARNGEAYYLHSTSKKAKKLAGFGPNADGSYGGFVPGAAFGDVVGGVGGGGSSGGGESVVQTGLTPGSYVTAVGWDR